MRFRWMLIIFVPAVLSVLVWRLGPSHAIGFAMKVAPDRLPVYGFDSVVQGFFWCAGQGGFGIQTSAAAAMLCAALLLERDLPPALEHVDAAVFSPARFGR